MISTLFIRNIRKVCFETTSTSTITVLFRLGLTIVTNIYEYKFAYETFELR